MLSFQEIPRLLGTPCPERGQRPDYDSTPGQPPSSASPPLLGTHATREKGPRRVLCPFSRAEVETGPQPQSLLAIRGASPGSALSGEGRSAGPRRPPSLSACAPPRAPGTLSNRVSPSEAHCSFPAPAPGSSRASGSTRRESPAGPHAQWGTSGAREVPLGASVDAYTRLPLGPPSGPFQPPSPLRWPRQPRRRRLALVAAPRST